MKKLSTQEEKWWWNMVRNYYAPENTGMMSYVAKFSSFRDFIPAVSHYKDSEVEKYLSHPEVKAMIKEARGGE